MQLCPDLRNCRRPTTTHGRNGPPEAPAQRAWCRGQTEYNEPACSCAWISGAAAGFPYSPLPARLPEAPAAAQLVPRVWRLSAAARRAGVQACGSAGLPPDYHFNLLDQIPDFVSGLDTGTNHKSNTAL